MAKLVYDTAEALLFDPVATSRNATRSALIEMGFVKVESIATVEAFARALYVRTPDLVLCEAQQDDTQVCKLIAGLRGGMVGPNPFVVVMVTAWDKTQVIVNRVLNCGADDLLLRPFSTGVLAGRIAAHVERRRGFVISHDYIGPDRRRDPDRAATNLFAPPNTLAKKAQGHENPDMLAVKLEGELREARLYLNTEKMRRDSFQICVLWRLSRDRKPTEPRVDADLAYVQTLARAIAKRNGDAMLAEVGPLCERIAAAAQTLRFGATGPDAMAQLERTAMALNRALNPSISPSACFEAIEAAATSIIRREAKPAAAPVAAPKPPATPATVDDNSVVKV